MTPTMPPRGRLKVEVLDERAVAVALTQVLGLDHQVAQARTWRDADLDRLLALLRLLREQFLVGGQPRLGLGLTGARRSAHPFQLAGQGALARGLGLFFRLQPLAFLFQPRGIVALPGDAFAPVELEDPARDIVEEVAVVGDGHDGAGVFLQVMLEPCHALGVEVVGGLVEQEQVGALEQDLAQGHAPAFATRQLGHVRVARRQAQGIHGDFQGAVEVPALGCLDGVLELGLLFQELVHFLGRDVLAEAQVHLVEARQQLLGSGHRLFHVAEHVLAGIELRLLRQVADA